MGLDYSFILVAERSKADDLVRAMSQHLTAKDRDRLLSSLPYDRSIGLKQVPRKPFEQQLFDDHGIEQLCLTFLVPIDAHVADFAKDFPRAVVDGKLPIGCVWCSILCESRFIAVHATAATSAMSRLFEESAAVQTRFAEIGRDGGASFVLFDDEQPESTIVVWPFRGRIPLQSFSRPFVDADSYYAAVLTEAQKKGSS